MNSYLFWLNGLLQNFLLLFNLLCLSPILLHNDISFNYNYTFLLNGLLNGLLFNFIKALSFKLDSCLVFIFKICYWGSKRRCGVDCWLRSSFWRFTGLLIILLHCFLETSRTLEISVMVPKKGFAICTEDNCSLIIFGLHFGWVIWFGKKRRREPEIKKLKVIIKGIEFNTQINLILIFYLLL